MIMPVNVQLLSMVPNMSPRVSSGNMEDLAEARVVLPFRPI